jgi:hypothetical protein
LLARHLWQHSADNPMAYVLVAFGLLMLFFCVYQVFMLAFRVQAIRVRENGLDITLATGQTFALPRHAGQRCFSGYVFALNATGGQKCVVYLAKGRILAIGDSMPNYEELSALLTAGRTEGTEGPS